LKTGETRYMFRIYLGTNPLTGKPKNTTRRSFKSKREAQLAYDRLKYEQRNGTLGKQAIETYKDIYLIWIKRYEKQVQESTFLKITFYLQWGIIRLIELILLRVRNTSNSGLRY